MKPTLVSLVAVAALALSGCGRQDTAASSSESSAQPAGSSASGTRASTSTNTASTSPATENWSELRTYEFERRGEFNSSLNAMSAKVEAEISRLKADASGAQASQSRRAALDELQSAKSDFDGKAAALGRASKDTWNQARDELAAAWDRLQASLAKARHDN
jgi:Skp family chaperone for outer membrane proteins